MANAITLNHLASPKLHAATRNAKSSSSQDIAGCNSVRLQPNKAVAERSTHHRSHRTTSNSQDPIYNRVVLGQALIPLMIQRSSCVSVSIRLSRSDSLSHLLMSNELDEAFEKQELERGFHSRVRRG